MFGSLLFAIALTVPARAEEEVEAPALAVVGDGEAVEKKRSKSSSRGSSKKESSEERSGSRPGRKLDTDKDGGRSITRSSSDSGESREARTTSRDRESDRHESADRSRKSDRPESADRSRSSSGHREASRASSSSRHSSDRHTVRSHTRAGHHEPAYRAASRHRAVAHASHASSRHHAAWSARHGHHRWYTPWRAGYAHHWYHGVFVYGPRVVVVDGGGDGGGGGGGGASSRSQGPKRDVNREGDFSIGVRGASYLSSFGPGEGYGDAGLGLTVRYRPIESLGFEAAWTYHDATWSADTARIQQPLQISAQAFAFPWSRVSPYVLAGVTMTERNLDQPLAHQPDLDTEDALWGPHAGVGIEFALGESVSLDFDARFIGYVNTTPEDPSAPGAFQGNMGLNFYF